MGKGKDALNKEIRTITTKLKDFGDMGAMFAASGADPELPCYTYIIVDTDTGETLEEHNDFFKALRSAHFPVDFDRILTQKELAERTGVSQPWISKLTGYLESRYMAIKKGGTWLYDDRAIDEIAYITKHRSWKVTRLADYKK